MKVRAGRLAERELHIAQSPEGDGEYVVYEVTSVEVGRIKRLGDKKYEIDGLVMANLQSAMKYISNKRKPDAA